MKIGKCWLDDKFELAASSPVATLLFVEKKQLLHFVLCTSTKFKQMNLSSSNFSQHIYH